MSTDSKNSSSESYSYYRKFSLREKIRLLESKVKALEAENQKLKRIIDIIGYICSMEDSSQVEKK